MLRFSRLRSVHDRYRKFVPGLTFLAGTLYDALTLSRIDRWHAMALLGVYLALVFALLAVEALELGGSPVAPPRWLQKVWHHREEACHFFLGNLLSAFTVLYFKSSSLVSSLAFFLVIAGLLVGNEFSALRRLGLALRSGLFAVSLTSYFACITPLWWGRIGARPFLMSIAVAAVLPALALPLLLSRVKDWRLLLRQVAYPYGGALIAFLAFYGLRIIPPVPLSLTQVGIYHAVERIKGGYRVTHSPPSWHFWERGDQRFQARPGDRIYCFFSIFSPAGFHEDVHVRWLFKDESKGWQVADSIPVAVAGGREQGYRGFAFKTSHKPGDWQVRIETSDDREIGRIHVNVAPVNPGEELEMTSEVL